MPHGNIFFTTKPLGVHLEQNNFGETQLYGEIM